MLDSGPVHVVGSNAAAAGGGGAGGGALGSLFHTRQCLGDSGCRCTRSLRGECWQRSHDDFPIQLTSLLSYTPVQAINLESVSCKHIKSKL
jgi:hypothetical protein